MQGGDLARDSIRVSRSTTTDRSEERCGLPVPATSTAQDCSQFSILGEPALGNVLVLGHLEDGSAFSGAIQWCRFSEQILQPIIGATHAQYCPEPRDVGYRLGVLLPDCGTGDEAALDEYQHPTPFAQPPPSVDGGRQMLVLTSAEVYVRPYFRDLVDQCIMKGGAAFNIIVVKGTSALALCDRTKVHVLEVSSQDISIKRNGTSLCHLSLSQEMQVCGVRGPGNAMSQSVFVMAKPATVGILSFQSVKERNLFLSVAAFMAQQQGASLQEPGGAQGIHTVNLSSGGLGPQEELA